MSKSDLEQLTGILKQFDNETILTAVRTLGMQPLEVKKFTEFGAGTIVIPPVFVQPNVLGFAGVAKVSTDCGPASAKATKWGDWNTNETVAETSAYTKAKGAAERACGGGCTTEGQACKYTQSSAELLDNETRQNESDQTEYRSKVKSEGACQCE